MSTCISCSKQYEPLAKNQLYCSKSCGSRSRYQRTPARHGTCEECGDGFSTKDPKGRFCSRSCAATHNNRKNPKRRLQGTCADCATPVGSGRRRCPRCAEAYRVQREVITIAEIRKEARYQKSAVIRNWARQAMRNSGAAKACRVCGYDVHVEVSHIVAINTFPASTPVAVVNALENLEYLCPNHHWEHDAGILDS